MELFPIMADQGRVEYIPFSVIEGHEAQAMRNHGQTLKRLAERGGLDYVETLAVLEDRHYTKMENKTAKAKVLQIINQS